MFISALHFLHMSLLHYAANRHGAGGGGKWVWVGRGGVGGDGWGHLRASDI